MVTYTITNVGPNFNDNLNNKIIGNTKATKVFFEGKGAELKIDGLATNNGLLEIRLGNNAKIHLGKNIKFFGKVRIIAKDNATVHLGDNGHFDNSNFTCLEGGRLVFGNTCRIHRDGIISVDENATLEIGERCSFRMRPALIAHRDTTVIFGNDCMTSWDLHCRCGEGHSLFDLTEGIKINSDNNNQKIIVGNHVWFGFQVMLMHGTHIGSNSMIGARSLVRDTFPKHSLVVGSPAKVIRENIDWHRNGKITFEEFSKLTD